MIRHKQGGNQIRLFDLEGEGHEDGCAGARLDLDRAMQLPGEHPDEAHAQGGGFLHVQPRGQADAIIRHAEADLLPLEFQFEKNPAGAFIREAVFHGVGDQLVDDEAAGNGLIQNEFDRLHPAFKAGFAGPGAEGAGDVDTEAFDVGIVIDPGEILGPVKGLMDERHGTEAVLGLLQDVDFRLIDSLGFLHVEEAADDLEVVLHPVMNLLEQDRLFLEGLLEVIERLPALGYVFMGDHHPCAAASQWADDEPEPALFDG